MNNLILAAPQQRYDRLEDLLRQQEGIKLTRIRTPDELLDAGKLESLNPRYIVFPHWSWMIPPTVFERYECVIFHMTDLPFGRGGSPLQNLMVRGFKETQLSALRCVAKVDAGPIYAKRPLSLLGTAEEIFLRAADLMNEMVIEIVSNNIEPLPQIGEPTFFQRRQRADGNLSGLDELHQVFDYIRMLDGEGYPPAFIETAQFRFEFSRASLKPDCVVADVRIVRKEHD